MPLMPVAQVQFSAVSQQVLYDSTLGGSAASFDTDPTSLGGYTHLLLRMALRTDNANNDITLRFNNDSGTNYDWENALFASAGSITQGVGSTSATIGYCALSTAPTDEFGTSEVWIPWYTGNRVKHAQTQCHARLAASSGNIYTIIGGASWRSTAAITRIQIIANSNFVAGSQVMVYGIN